MQELVIPIYLTGFFLCWCLDCKFSRLKDPMFSWHDVVLRAFTAAVGWPVMIPVILVCHYVPYSEGEE